MGEVAHEDAWRTHVQYLLSQNVSFKPHIFNPTAKPSSELRKQHFFIGAYRVYQFTINSKVSRRFPRDIRRSLAKDLVRGPWYNLFRVAPFAATRAKQNVGWKPAVRKIHCAKKRENRGRKGEKNKSCFDGRKRVRGASSNISSGTMCVAVFCISSSLPTDSIPDISRRSATRRGAAQAKRITFIPRFRG